MYMAIVFVSIFMSTVNKYLRTVRALGGLSTVPSKYIAYGHDVHPHTGQRHSQQNKIQDEQHHGGHHVPRAKDTVKHEMSSQMTRPGQGESDDEVEAALWMYSKREVFGRTSKEHIAPPATAKIRPVNQIDLVPTLSLLLGIPIPFNNLGRPIEEAFAGKDGKDWANLAAVSRMAAAGIERYQAAYFKARGIKPDANGPGSGSTPSQLWRTAAEVTAASGLGRDSYAAFVGFQQATLALCKSLWARFDISRMIAGVVTSALGVVVLLMYASRDADDEFVVVNDIELDYAETRLELLEREGENGNVKRAAESGNQTTATPAEEDPDIHRRMLKKILGLRGCIILGSVVAAGLMLRRPVDQIVIAVVAGVMLPHAARTLSQAGRTVRNLLPATVWGWMSVVFTVSQSVGFAANSFTVWEDTMLLFYTTTFGVAATVSSLRLSDPRGRALAVYHSVVFTLLGRLASYSKLCREEQMPYCVSTYYASSNSSTSAPWQLLIPFAAALLLPTIVKGFLASTRSYEGLAPFWIGIAFPASLLAAAGYWVVDAASNGDWLADYVQETTVKTTGIYMAQLVLALSLVAGTTAFTWAPPNISIVSSAAAAAATPGKAGSNRGRVAILGYANTAGARYLYLPLNILTACMLLSKPMGFGALAVMMWQVLSLAEILDLNGLKSETIGPVMLALLGNLYYFKTGHQATLSSIQWDSAFIPLSTIRYPWTPVVVTLNTFGAQILAAVAVPLVILWKVGPKQRGVLETVSRGMAAFAAYYAVESLATMAWAGHLRRHLMLYRVFSPRYMMAAVVLLVLDLVLLGVALPGVRVNVMSISDVFGWNSG